MGSSITDLCSSIIQKSSVNPIHAQSLELDPILVSDFVKADDLVLTQGAGSVTKLVAMLTDTELGQVTI